MEVCRLEKVSKTYPLGELEVRALSDVSLEVQKGEFTVFAGPSGSGKSTLLNLVGLLDSPTEGHIYLRGKKTSDSSEVKLGNIRATEIGFIFQSFHLIPVLTAFENVELALRLSGKHSPKTRKERTEKALLSVGLGDLFNRRPKQLSGGQQQRVAIARALVKEPALVIADEPTANLDSKNGAQILDLMSKLNKEQEATFLFSSHDPMVIDRAKRVIRLQDGQINSDETR